MPFGRTSNWSPGTCTAVISADRKGRLVLKTGPPRFELYFSALIPFFFFDIVGCFDMATKYKYCLSGAIA